MRLRLNVNMKTDRFRNIFTVNSYINIMDKSKRGINIQNLIMNSKWAPGPSGGPQYFSAVGPVTYDKLSITGYRTCSITMTTPAYAQDYYDPLINVQGKTSIYFRYIIRSVDADAIYLVAEFTNNMGAPVMTTEKMITKDVSYNFNEVTAKFMIPPFASKVRLALKFMGKVTACTYYSPAAYYGQ